MLDPQVTNVKTRSVTGFDPVTLLPSRMIQISYMVGEHGPFVTTTPEDKFDQAYLEEITGKTVKTLRGAGVLPQSV